MVYYNRVKKVAEFHNLDVEYITPSILNLKDGKCDNPDCKCHKSDFKRHRNIFKILKLKFFNNYI